MNITDIFAIAFQGAMISYTPEKLEIKWYGKDPFTHKIVLHKIFLVPMLKNDQYPKLLNDITGSSRVKLFFHAIDKLSIKDALLFYKFFI